MTYLIHFFPWSTHKYILQIPLTGIKYMDDNEDTLLATTTLFRTESE